MLDPTTARTCPFCGLEFQPTAKHPNKRYCSVKCSTTAMGKANAHAVPRQATCKTCGTSLGVAPGRKLYCSKACNLKGRPRRGTSPAEPRFWAKVEKTEGCWNWTAGTTSKGYGVFHPTKGQNIIASRYAWELANGPIPEGLFVLHHCDNPKCIRAEHLFLGSIADNNRDMTEKGRKARGEKHGMVKLTAEMVREIRRRYEEDGEAVGSIARSLPAISRPSISMIVHRKTWRHLE